MYLSFYFADCLNDVFVIISQVLWFICFPQRSAFDISVSKQLHVLSSECRYASVAGTNTAAESVAQLYGPSGASVFRWVFFSLCVFF